MKFISVFLLALALAAGKDNGKSITRHFDWNKLRVVFSTTTVISSLFLCLSTWCS